MAQPPVSSKEKWESRYRAGDFEPNREPVPFLAKEASDLKPGRALCLAAGAGRNAVFLAELGFAVTAVDISPAGLAWCRRLAAECGVEVETVAADLRSFDAGVESWDLVTNLYFHDPVLFPRVRAAVKSGGHFLFQTYAKAQARFGWGPSNPDHLVDPERLRQAFAGWRGRPHWRGYFPPSTAETSDTGSAGRSAPGWWWRAESARECR